MWRFVVGEVNYESLLRNFNRATEFVRIFVRKIDNFQQSKLDKVGEKMENV